MDLRVTLRAITILCGAGLSIGCGRSEPARDLPARSALEFDQRRGGDALVRTFSIVALDPESGVCGAAVASMYPAVGEVVPFAKGGVGAFCTQHYSHPEFGKRAIELLEAGKSPQQVLDELLRDDKGAAGRQLAVVDRHGRTANHNPTGAGTRSRWWGAMSGRFYTCQGNTLTGPEVVTSMAAAYETTKGSLADRLMAALVAGDCAGGDHRGRLAAGIIVAKPGVDGLWLNLHTDNSDDAEMELAKKYIDTEHAAKGEWAKANTPWKNPCPDRPEPKAPSESK
jgi:uncharacterized Ntn-hydrolase superfamily protein